MMNKRWKKATLFFLTVALVFGFQSHHFSTADMNTAGGVTCNTLATGFCKAAGNGMYVWTAWADYFAKIYASGRNVGDSVDGRIEVSAYIDGGTNPADINKNFTIRVKGWGFIKWGEVYMEHHYSDAITYSPSRPSSARASSGGHCHTVTAMTETWP